MKKKIVLMPGDGIGPEVTNEAVRVLEFTANNYGIELEFTEQLIGGCSYEAHGKPLTDTALNACFDSDAVLLGAVGGYKWERLPHYMKPEAALLRLRKELGLYANIRPARVYEPLLGASSLKEDVVRGTDFIVLRELTGGIYFGQPRGTDADSSWNTMIYTTEEVVRIAKAAFKIAAGRHSKVTSVDKANVLEVSQFWRNIVQEVHEDYPDIVLSHMYVDNAAMQIVRSPRQFDVILTSNLFGDILSDIAGMITGSLGMLPSASLGDKYALYEPVHGSAPDIAGQKKANPLAAISSVAMMFNYTFGMPEAGSNIDAAILKTLEAGLRTPDIQSPGCEVVSTTEMTDMVLSNLQAMVKDAQTVQAG